MTGIPRHGWLAFGRAVERRFLELGGDIRYGAQVARLRTSGGAVNGVELASGEVVATGRVLSAADGRFTHTVLLGEQDDGRFDPRRVSDQPVQVNLGVAEDWSSGALTFLLADAPAAGGRGQRRVTVHSKHYDPDAAPPGKSALTVFLESDHGFWKALESDRAAYEAEKQRCADLVIGAIGRHRDGFAANIEVVDVSTPLTRERYTGNWLGAMQAMRPDAGMVKVLLQSSPRYDHPGLAGFFMAGQWVESWAASPRPRSPGATRYVRSAARTARASPTDAPPGHHRHMPWRQGRARRRAPPCACVR